MNRDELRSFVFGALFMLVLVTFVTRIFDPYKQYIEVKSLKTECEKNLPRSENCVIIMVLPRSKD